MTFQLSAIINIILSGSQHTNCAGQERLESPRELCEFEIFFNGNKLFESFLHSLGN